ncbi:uncharacterized protein EV422DRAFT_435436 [Fimicolochytrium jonesii]|uniref:uncharacterized protein n=1 Tax=Fimicolochytrium jonesii TaxID=1396493 RepID=UPI0022FF24E7|nr:uncharacterized protein EV422DRAFT_435436 [Fimicolochytrium jonesii]KAI8821861.1 hypothetical protein EV422DRAFT_435436 [Fimicolochytrium jonesii]
MMGILVPRLHLTLLTLTSPTPPAPTTSPTPTHYLLRTELGILSGSKKKFSIASSATFSHLFLDVARDSSGKVVGCELNGASRGTDVSPAGRLSPLVKEWGVRVVIWKKTVGSFKTRGYGTEMAHFTLVRHDNGTYGVIPALHTGDDDAQQPPEERPAARPLGPQEFRVRIKGGCNPVPRKGEERPLFGGVCGLDVEVEWEEVRVPVGVEEDGEVELEGRNEEAMDVDGDEFHEVEEEVEEEMIDYEIHQHGIEDEGGDADIDNYIENEVDGTQGPTRVLVVGSPRALRRAARKRSISSLREEKEGPPSRNLRPRTSASVGICTNVEKFEDHEQSQPHRNLRPRTSAGSGICKEPGPLIVDEEGFVEDEEIIEIVEAQPDRRRRSVARSVTNDPEPTPQRTLRPRSSSAITVDTKDGIVELEAGRHRERVNTERANEEKMAAYDVGTVLDYSRGYHTATNLPILGGDEEGYDSDDHMNMDFMLATQGQNLDRLAPTLPFTRRALYLAWNKHCLRDNPLGSCHFGKSMLRFVKSLQHSHHLFTHTDLVELVYAFKCADLMSADEIYRCLRVAKRMRREAGAVSPG